MVILVTGANGFVGSALCSDLGRAGYVVRRAVRRLTGQSADPVSGDVAIGDIGPETDWARALSGAGCVVHLAARTHVVREASFDALAAYRRVNVEATRRLAQQATAAGVRRLVFLSSIKVNGEATSGHAYNENDRPLPQDAYGLTKWEAEQELFTASADGLEVVVLRPPLVYGPRVKGNFLRLLRLVARGIPLPFASVENRRSLIYVSNLCAAVLTAIVAPQARGRTYLVSDGEDASTPGLVRALAHELGVKPRLFACPASVLRAAGAVVGKNAELKRLTGSLQIDASRIRDELKWQPPHTFSEGLAETARWYHAQTGA